MYKTDFIEINYADFEVSRFLFELNFKSRPRKKSEMSMKMN